MTTSRPAHPSAPSTLALLLLATPLLLLPPAHAVPLDDASVTGATALDWSSTFGGDYSASSDGTIIGSGSLSPNPWGAVQPGGDYSVTSSRTGLLGGNFAATTGVQMGNFGALDPSNFFRYSVTVDMHNPANDYGVDGIGYVNSYYYFDTTGFSAFGDRTRVYWVAEWTLSTTGQVDPGRMTGRANMGGASSGNPTLTLDHAGSLTSTWTGYKDLPEWNSVFSAQTSFLQFDLMAQAGGASIPPGTQFTATVDLAFWDQPFDRIVRQPDSKVPDHGSVGLFLLGTLGALGLARRRGPQCA